MLVDSLGNLVAVLREADPTDKAEVYRQLGLHLTYQAAQQKVRAEAHLDTAPLGRRFVFEGELNRFSMSWCCGRTFRESPHVGAEYVDDLGRSYDALGSPAASAHWNEQRFLQSIDSHLLKSNYFTVIDLTGFTSSQVRSVSRYVDSLSREAQARIVRIGF